MKKLLSTLFLTLAMFSVSISAQTAKQHASFFDSVTTYFKIMFPYFDEITADYSYPNKTKRIRIIYEPTPTP
jgi:hypothetical protein